MAAACSIPSYLPECTLRPGASYQGCHASVEYGWPSTSMTCLMGNPYCFAKAKSRSSCPGTAITAPEP